MNDYNNQSNMYKAPYRDIVHKKSGLLTNVLLVVFLISTGFLGWKYYENQKELSLIKNPEAQVEAEKEAIIDIVEKAEKIVLLPKNVLPQVLTVVDADAAVRQQPSLDGVVTGDKILVYEKVSKAVVYSPSRNIIVNILPVYFQQNNKEDSGVSNDAPKVVSTSTQTIKNR